MSRVTSSGACLARDDRRADHHVALGHHAAEQLALALVERLVLGARIATRILGILGLDRQFDEAPPQALHLFLGRRPHVVSGSDGSQPSRRSDGLKPHHACTDNEDVRRSDGSRGRGQHGEHARQPVRGQQHCFVTADRGHRGQRVHALGARGARHEFNGK